MRHQCSWERKTTGLIFYSFPSHLEQFDVEIALITIICMFVDPKMMVHEELKR